MKMLFSAAPLYGHVNTMLPLALAAQRAGHQVLFGTGPDLVEHVRRVGLDGRPMGLTHAQAGGSNQASWLAYFARTAQARAEDLVPMALQWQPDVVVHEDTELAGAVAAAACNARHHWVHGLSLMPPPSLREGFMTAVSSLALRWSVGDAWQRLEQATYLEVCPPALRQTGDRLWARSQPLRPATGVPAPDDALPRGFHAMPHARTIALTLGTVFSSTDGARDVFAAALAGLRRLEANIVVLAGPGADVTEWGEQPSHVLVSPYVPYALLLPKIDLLVSQGGAGGMFGALSEGLPQLLMPQGGDQFANTEACVSAGAALALLPTSVTADRVATLASHLLADRSYAQAAQRVRREIGEMPDAQDVLQILLATD